MGKKFDVVIGNPPFQSPIKGDGSLWSKFIQKSYEVLNEEEGVMAYISPSSFVQPGPNIRKGKINVFNEFLRNNLIYVNIGECSRHFQVGHGDRYFGAFVLRKSNKPSTNTQVVTKTDKFMYDVSNMTYLPFDGDAVVFNIFEKVMQHNKKNGTYGFQRGGGYKPYKKVVAFLQSQYVPYEKVIIGDIYGKLDIKKINVNMAWIDASNVNYHTLETVFTSKLFKFLASYLFYASFKQDVQNSFPYFDLTKSISKEDMYNKLGLTKQEINLIENQQYRHMDISADKFLNEKH